MKIILNYFSKYCEGRMSGSWSYNLDIKDSCVASV